MKTCFYAVILILFCLVLEQRLHGQSAGKLIRISVQGNKFIDASGKVVAFRGLNTSDPDKLAREGRWAKGYFEEMKKWGANLVRFPVHPTAWRSQGEKKIPRAARPRGTVGKRIRYICDYRLAFYWEFKN